MAAASTRYADPWEQRSAAAEYWFAFCVRRFKPSMMSYDPSRHSLPPNPSVKRSAAGRPPSPRAAVVYPASRGLGVLPSSRAYLER